MGIMQEPCFVPNYVDANMSDAEFINMLDDCLPRAIVERISKTLNVNGDIIAAGKLAAEKVQAAVKTCPEEDEVHEAKIGADIDALTIAELRERIHAADKMIEKLNDMREDLADAESALSELGWLDQ